MAASLKIEKLGLNTLEDCLFHLPSRYENATTVVTLKEAKADLLDVQAPAVIQVEAEVQHSEVVFRPRRQWLVWLKDQEGEPLLLRFFNFYSSQVNKMAVGQKLRVRGQLKLDRGSAVMLHPSYTSADVPLPEELTPVYPATAGVSQARIRAVISNALKSLPIVDTVPADLLKRYGLIDINQALLQLHRPPKDADLRVYEERTHPAWQRIKFDELLAQQLSLRLAHQRRRRLQTVVLKEKVAGDSLLQNLAATLPFSLTGAQARVIEEIHGDLGRSYPMRRLLQGDVGSGKTIVAAFAAALAIDNDYQVALMAPTAILAEQHFQKIAAWIEPLGINTAWLISRQTKKQKDLVYELIRSGTSQLVIGTHALIQEGVEFARLGLVVVDEQHRFGVSQRQALRHRGDHHPHLLMMSATPIPRSLAMSYFADLDLSTIDELPPGRKPVLTKVIAAQRRGEVVTRVADAIAAGQQVYWVCPLIEESEVLDLNTVNEIFATLQAALPQHRLGLLHGQLKPAEKSRIMQAFAAHDIDMLVATTVIEVGVDVANASVMVVENAEHFGLSQLHQLRGRVGRGNHQAVCLLLYQTPLSFNAKKRLKIMHECSDGFEIARRDLELRGPGEFLGARQSGAALMRFADLNSDGELLEWATTATQILLEKQGLAAMPDAGAGGFPVPPGDAVEQPGGQVQAHIERWLAGRISYLES